MRLFLRISLALAVACAILGTVALAQMSGSGPNTGARWICKEVGTGETANAVLKDSGSTQLVCKEVFVTLKTVSGKTLVIGNATSKTGAANKATKLDMTAQDAKAQQDAADVMAAEFMAGGGG